MSLRHAPPPHLLTHSQNGNPTKINPENVACFSTTKSDHQFTTIYQRSTTNSPSKNHAKMPVFAKTASKNGHFSPEKNYCKSPSSGCILASSGGITTAAATLS